MSSDELTTIAQKAARGGLFLFVGNTSSTVILAVGAIIVARLLGPFNYGLYSLTIAIPILLVAFSDAGMNYALVRLPARARSEGDQARADRLIRLGFLFKLAISVLAFLICYAASKAIAIILLNRPDVAPFIQLASLMILFQAVYDAASNAFIGQDLMQYSAATQIMQAVLKGTLGPALVFIGWGITGAISGYLLALAAAGATGASILFSKYARSSTQTIDSASTLVRELLGYGLPLYVANILSVFLSQYQNIVLAHFASNVEIGNFAASWTFTTFMAVLSYPITTAMFPMFSKMDPEKQKGDLARGFVLAVKYTSLLMIPASLVVMAFSRDLIYVTFGRSYTSAPQYLSLLSTLYLLAAIGSVVLSSFLSGVAETGTLVKMSGLTLAVYLPLALALALLWGAYGVLVAYILSNAASTIYGVRQSSRKYDAGPDLRAGGRILVAALVAAVPVIVLIELHPTGVGLVNLVVGGLLYVFMYLTVAPIMGAVDKFDVANLGTILSFAPLQYRGVELRFVAAAELGQHRLEENILEITTLEGNVLDLRLVRSQARAEEKEGKKSAARIYRLMTCIAAALTDSVLDYERRLLSAVEPD
jgi:O-antigen/teichoic acid export membrane protein